MRSCDHRNIMILYQGFPNWGVPLVICKPLKSGTRAALCQEQGGGRSWFSADLEETGKGCLGSECCSKCQMLPLWLLLALHKGADAAFLEEGGLEEYREGGEQRDGSSHSHSHTHCALTHENHSVPISSRLSGAQSSLEHLSSWTLLSQSKYHSIPPSLLLCSPEGSWSTGGHYWAAATHWQPAPRKKQVWEALYYSQTEKEVRSTTRWMRHTNPYDLMKRWHIWYFFWLCIKAFLCLHAWYTYLFWQTPSVL